MTVEQGLATPDAPAVEVPAASPGRVLLVDDEASILSALRRLLRPHGFTVFTAESGQAALELLEREPIDLVVSDMRMPEMDGAQLLEKVFTRWPDTKRILLTGHSDTAATIAAINLGKIWRYVAKPWNDEELIMTIEQALAHRRLLQENARLAQLTKAQNEALRELNAGLETKVAERTNDLERANVALRQGFLRTVHVFADLIEMRESRLAGHSRRVAELARRLAERLGFSETDQQDMLLAGLLHDIGKIGLPDGMIVKPFNALPPAAKNELMQHAAKGEQLLKGIDQLAQVAKLVRHHHESFDGSGYPDGLAGLAIPFGARILAVANDYDALLMGTLMLQPQPPREAQAIIVRQRGKRYDPHVVDAFMALMAEAQAKSGPEFAVGVNELRNGMILTRDVAGADGAVLFTREHVVNNETITALRQIEAAGNVPLTLTVRGGLGAAVVRQEVEKPAPRRTWKEVVLTTGRLKEGMKLARPLYHRDGYLLLARGYHLDDTVIKQLRDIETADGQTISVYIQVDDH